MKLLVVDDEKLIRDVIKEYAENEGYIVYEAEDGLDAISKVEKNPNIDIIIMDIMMPRLDGYSSCKEIYKIKKYPTIMLSARKEEYDKLLGFELGIDDYVTKPFSPKELMARVKAIIARVNNQKEKNYKYEDLEVNYNAHSVKIKGKEIKLTPKEYELLIFFIKNEGMALSREQLLSSIWGYDFFGDDRTVDTHIKMLRNSLGKYRDLIITVRSVGYKFETDNE
ncbi:MAG: response regulator transcription factor [Bacilli bacterium]|nr:response regulator transcription factor [Bacilli bacterium]